MINIEDYKQWVSNHFQKAADLALRPRVMALFENANLLFEKAKMELSVKEEEFVRKLLATQAIPSPKLLIKDHKTVNEKGEFPTRLLIPTTTFTAIFSKIGYLGIKKVPGQRKSELLMRLHRPGLQHEGKTRRIRGK